MDKKKVLIISSVFFPRNSPRAHRTTELAIELSKQGHFVTVFALLGDYNYSDFEKKYRLTVRDLGDMNFVTLNSDGKEMKLNFFKKAFIKFGGKKFFEFPDIELSYKVFKVLKCNRQQFDLLITIAVPFPIHWGAAYAKNRVNVFPKVWVADCGDPYMGNPAHNHPCYFKYVEKWFSRKVDYISIPTKNAIQAYYPEFHSKIKIIPQGVNLDKFQSLLNYTKNTVPTFVYAGAFYKKIRDPRPFLEYLCNIEDDFLFVIFTKSNSLIEEFKNRNELKNI